VRDDRNPKESRPLFMPPSPQSEVVEEINRRVDPQLLLERINFRPEIVPVGTNLKTFCPIHADTQIKTFLLYPSKGTYQCTYRPCPGYKGGTLVEFYGLYQGIVSPLQAAFSLAKFMGLDLDDSLLQRLCDGFIAEGKRTLEQGKLDEANEFVVHALEVGPHQVEPHLLASQLAHARGAMGDAIEHAQRATATAESGGDISGAIRILADHVLDLLPDDEDSLLHLADLHESIGENDPCVDCLLKVARIREDRDELVSAIPVMERVLSHQPLRTDTRLTLARALEQEGQLDAAADHYLRSIDFLESGGQEDDVLPILQHMREALPANWTARERLAGHLLSTGNEGEYLRELEAMAELAAGRGENERAEQYAQQVLERDDTAVEARETLARVYENRGDTQALAREKMLLADLYAKLNQTERMLDSLRSARTACPEDASIREQFVDKLVETGDERQAARELLQLGRLYFELGQPEDAESTLSRLTEFAPEDSEGRLQVAALYEEFDKKDRAIQECRQLAQTLSSSERWEDVLLATERGLGLEPKDADLRQLHIQALRALERNEDAVGEYRVLIDLLLERGDDADAEKAVEEALQLQPENIDLQRLLVDLYLRTERPDDALGVLRGLARLLESQKQVDTLIETCDRILELSPDDLDTRALLAEQYLAKGLAAEACEEFERVGDENAKAGAHPAALEHYERVIDIDPGALAVLRKMADLVVEHDSPEAAQPHFRKIISVVRTYEDSEALDREYRNLLERDPTWNDLRREYAEWLLEQDKREAAFAEFLRLAEDLVEGAGDLDAASDIYLKLIEADPERVEFHSGLGRLYERQGDTAKATAAKGTAVDLLLAAGNKEEGLEVLEDIVRLVPSNEDVRLRLVDLLAELDRTAQAVENLQTLASQRKSRDREEENVLVYRRILDLDADQQDVRRSLAEALENGDLLEEATEQWLLLAEALEGLERHTEAIRVCRHVAELDPEDPTPRLRLANLFEATGDFPSLREEYDGLVALYRSLGDLDHAANTLRRMITQEPDDLTLCERLGKILEEQGEGEEACDLFVETARKYMDQEEYGTARALLARVKTLQPERREARIALAAACESMEDLHAAAREHLDLAQMAFESSDPDAAHEHADQVGRLAGDDWDLIIELAHVFSRNQQHESAGRQLRSAIEKAAEAEDSTGGLTLTREAIRLSPESRDLHERRVHFLLLAGRTADAVEEYRTLADLALEEADREAAALYYGSLVDLVPKDIPAHLNLADLLIELEDSPGGVKELALVLDLQSAEGRVDDAIETAGRILELAPDHTNARASRVDLCLKSGRADQAAEDLQYLADRAAKDEEWAEAEQHLRRVLAIDPDSLEAVRKLARVILEYRSLDDARPVLQRRIELAVAFLDAEDLAAEYEDVLGIDARNPDFRIEFARHLHAQEEDDRAAEQFSAAADLLEKESEFERALDVLEEQRNLRSDDYGVVGRIGRVLLRLDRRQDARQAFVEAGEGLISRGDLAEGVTAFLQALEINPDDEQLLARVASLYEEAEDSDQAKALYLRLVALQEKRGASEEAAESLRRILVLAPGDLEIRERLAETLESLERTADAVVEWLVYAEKAEDQREVQRAIAACLHIKEIDPSAKENRLRLIRHYRELQELEAAKAEISQLADLHEGLEEFDEVEALLRQGIEIDPGNRAFRGRLAEFYAGHEQIDRATETLAELARLCLDQQDPAEAVETYRRIAELKPTDHRARQTIVGILEDEGKTADAADEALALVDLYLQGELTHDAVEWARKAIQLDSGRPERVLQAAERLRAAGRDEEARDLVLRQAQDALDKQEPQAADTLLAGALEWYPGQVDLLTLRIQSCLASEDAHAALEVCKTLAHSWHEANELEREEQVWNQALDLDPSDVESHEGKIAVLESLGDERTADAVEALRALSTIHVSADRPRRAIDCLRRCLEHDPLRNDIRESLAGMLLDAGDWPSALEEFLELAQRHLREDQKDEARRYFEKVLELDSENLDALRTLLRITRDQSDHGGHIRFSESLAAVYIQASARDDAIQCYQDLLEFSPDHLEGWETLGRLLEEEERIDEAVEVWRRLTDEYQRAGDTYAAIENLQKIERRLPEDISTARALADLSRAVNDPATSERYQRVVELGEQSGDLEQAAEAATALVDLLGDDPVAHRTLARLHKARGNQEEAAASLIHAASLLETAGKPAEAAQVLDELLEFEPEKYTERERLARLLRESGDNEKAADQLLILADAYGELGNSEDAVQRCKDVLDLDPAAFQAHDRLLRLYTTAGDVSLALGEVNWLVEYHTEQKDLDRARESLEAGLDLDPQNVPLLEQLADLHIEAGRPDEATSQYLRIAEAALVRGDSQRATQAMERARDCSPDDVEIRRNLAEIYVRQGDNERARAESFEIARLYLAQGLVADARGSLDALIIQTPKDIELRSRIAELYVEHAIPELAALQYVELARLRKQAEDPEGVITYAGEALALKPRTIEAKELQVEAQIQLGDFDAAFETYSDLAELYAQSGQPERAATCFRPMIEMRPEDPEPRQCLIDTFLRLNRTDEAVEEMRQLAGLHVEAERIDEALATYRKILETAPDDTQARLAYIEAYSQTGPESDLVDDYIQLASLFAAENKPDQATHAYEKALSIVPDHKANRLAFIEFLLDSNQIPRAQQEAETLSTAYLEEGENREATTLLQKILKAAPDNTELRLRLAEAHGRLNARGMALKELRLVAKAYDKNGNVEGLVDTYRQILDIDPQNVETRQQLIELLEGQRRHEEAAEQHMQLADVYMSRHLLDLARDEYRGLLRLQPENLTAWTYLVATREQLGDTDTLADDYLALGKVHDAQGQPKDALEQYKKAVDAGPAHLEARRQYIEAYKKTGSESDLIDDYLALADMLVLRNRVDEAVEIYSQVVKLDPENDTARKKLVDTQARRAGLAQAEATGAQTHPTPVPDTVTPTPADSAVSSETAGADQDVPEEVAALAEEEAGLDQVVANYQDILQVNPQNANVRLKLADLYEQMGREEDAMNELVRASEIFFQKSELAMCITVCERVLAKDSSCGKVRERLSKAVLKRDAFKALESAIQFSDQASQIENPTDPGGRRHDSRDTL